MARSYVIPGKVMKLTHPMRVTPREDRRRKGLSACVNPWQRNYSSLFPLLRIRLEKTMTVIATKTTIHAPSVTAMAA